MASSSDSRLFKQSRETLNPETGSLKTLRNPSHSKEITRDKKPVDALWFKCISSLQTMFGFAPYISQNITKKQATNISKKLQKKSDVNPSETHLIEKKICMHMLAWFLVSERHQFRDFLEKDFRFNEDNLKTILEFMDQRAALQKSTLKQDNGVTPIRKMSRTP